MTQAGKDPLRVCIDARLTGGGASGGVESVVIGMAHGLSRLNDGDEEYLFLAWADDDAQIDRYVSGPCRMLYATSPPTGAPKRWTRRALPFAEPLRNSLVSRFATGRIRPLESDGTIERAAVDIMHFTRQTGFLTSVPSIYHPHDLQHRHFPEYFSRYELHFRDRVYGSLCDQATLVATTSTWVKTDLEHQFGLDPAKVRVVPLAPVLDAYPEPSDADLARLKEVHSLPSKFLLYPAQTWAHKNHLGLLNAVAILREQRGLAVDVVCTGHLNDFFREIDHHRRRLRLEEHFRFLGFIAPLDLRALYRLATGVVVPSKFEAASGPLWDAFLAEVPAACAAVTSLPMQAGDAALLFDPDDPARMADALHRLWTDEALRQTLVARGRENVSRFTWERTARHFRAYYRQLSGRPLSDEDREMISAPAVL
jgi:glycosyltransferase involved in cell wall biosynthesis